MSTLLVAGSPGDNIDTLTIEPGSGMQTSSIVEVQINLAHLITDNGGMRQISRDEVVLLLEAIKNEIIRGNWSYAAS